MNQVLPEILKLTACKFPEHGIGFVGPDGAIRFTTYPELLDQSARYLATLQSSGMMQGDVVILSLDKSSEIIPVLWACFFGGIIPALLQPPVSFSDYNPAAEKAAKVYEVLGQPWVILSHAHFETWKSTEIPEYRLIDFEILENAHGEPVFPELAAEDLALVQFSSGSTGDPKGVMLSHRNILVNIMDIIQGILLQPDDISTNWMPLFHDMGLFGFHITPLFVGTTQYFIEPVDFVKNPFLWLDTMDKTKATVTASPNFGQMILNRYLSRKTTGAWDLSSLCVIFNGAEPISVPIMREFMQGLQQFGCDPMAMFPAYGMAEATLAVTFPPLFSPTEVISLDRSALLKEGIARIVPQEASDTIELVNLGHPLDHCQVQIVDDKGKKIPEDHVGNVWVEGENVSNGYINNPLMTETLLSDSWLRTGDLGFLHNGNLFITGRTKDIIFVNGTNFYAHDLENITREIPEVPSGKIVMGGYFDEKEGHDKIVVFMVGAANDATHDIFVKIRDLFKQSIGLTIDTFIPIRSNDIPRTSSGKIQRYRLIERYMKNEFPNIFTISQ